MSRLLEENLPIIKEEGLKTDKPVVLGSTLSVAGVLTATGAVVTPNQAQNQTVTTIATQNATLTVAQILGGVILHDSNTGGGTVTLPIGTLMSAGCANVAVGTVIKWLYDNYGNQTATITAGADHTIIGGTAAVTTGKHVLATSYCSAANTWVTFLTTLF